MSDSPRRLSHPLSGANPATLARVLALAGAPEARSLPQVTVAALATLGRWPFSLAERAYVAAKRPGTVERPPIFILGHWRSGTTHLYNILSKAPQFGYVSPFATGLPWDFLLLGNLVSPLLEKALPEHRYIDNIGVDSDSPQEDELALANMTPLSFYHGLYFPRRFDAFLAEGVFFDGVDQAAVARWQKTLRYLYLKLQIAQPETRLIIKNPVYTARADLLDAMWPEAQFVHIHRNPYKVFVSMRNFYQKLFEQFALQPWDAVDIDEAVFATYERMMDKLAADTAHLPPGRFVEMRYDDLAAEPLAQLARLYEQLGLAGFDADRPRYEAYLASVADYRKNVFSMPQELQDRIRARWGRFIDQWDYTAPAV
ncbi:sulfotransferase [Rhodothalassium salexigens]|uniref:sulfotransferase n=1 Tax=Rhodothalassium salexigens TaxID=1086 RepID=UPI0019125A90